MLNFLRTWMDKRWPRNLQVDQGDPFLAARGYTGASSSYQFDDWFAENQTANEEVLAGGARLRDRSREAERNDEYIRQFIKMNEKNVVGQGLRLNMAVIGGDGKPDKDVNDAIEKAWIDWSKQENASATRRNSWLNIQQMWSTTIARDGEIFVQKIRGFDNPYGFALQPVEADFVPYAFDRTREGNEIVMGLEVNNWGGVLAYWFNPTPSSGNTLDSASANRLEADDVCHGYKEERPGQLRGVPETHAALAASHLLKGYREAEVTGARAAACQMGEYKRDPGFSEADGDVDKMDAYIFKTFAPGDVGVTPKGWMFETHNNTSVNNNSKDFMKTIIRGIASGLDVSYNVLANDYEGVNFSSLRGAVLEAREGYKIKQDMMINDLAIPTFETWLFEALIRRQIKFENGTPLSVLNFEKYNKPQFIARPFEWVDPLKDAQRSILEVQQGWNSDARIAKQRGVELEDMYKQQAQSLALKKKIYEEAGVGELLETGEQRINNFLKLEDRTA